MVYFTKLLILILSALAICVWVLERGRNPVLKPATESLPKMVDKEIFIGKEQELGANSTNINFPSPVDSSNINISVDIDTNNLNNVGFGLFLVSAVTIITIWYFCFSNSQITPDYPSLPWKFERKMTDERIMKNEVDSFANESPLPDKSPVPDELLDNLIRDGLKRTGKLIFEQNGDITTVVNTKYLNYLLTTDNIGHFAMILEKLAEKQVSISSETYKYIADVIQVLNNSKLIKHEQFIELLCWLSQLKEIIG